MLELDHSRRGLVSQLVGVATAAGRALVHGPWGIGKTTLLFEAARQVRASGLRTGYAPRTLGLGDVVAALEQAYGAAHPDVPARRRRSSLRVACELDVGLLLLDGFSARGSALVGFLRSLRGKRLGVIAAADVEHHQRLPHHGHDDEPQ